MSSCRLRPFVRMFLLFCLFAMICQQILLHGLNLDVNGETTLTSNRSIDLYTQKEPYSGRGSNQPSDAFAPQEEVILYGYVAYRDFPVSGKIVAFEVHGPINSAENLSFTRTAVTDEEGVVNVSFRIPCPNGYAEEVIFGVWSVIAVVDIAEVAVNDTLTFEVCWVVELLKVETADINNVSRTSFKRNEYMSFRLTVKNIAMTHRVVTLVIDVYDNHSVSLGQVTLVDKQIAPGIKVLFIEGLLIPESACLGVGVVYANAYTTLLTLGGVPWCPEVSTTFSIVEIPPIVHDVAVISVVPSVTEVFPCQTVNISVVIANEGEVVETFDVSTYYDSVLIGKSIVDCLAPQAEKTLMFYWYTCRVPPGSYTLSAEASVVPGELNIENNRFVDGVVWVKLGVLPIAWEIPRWLLALLFLLAVFITACLAAAIVFALLWRRERKKKGQMGRQPTYPEVKPRKEVGFKRSKTCSVCGKEFSEVYTFCPYCFTFHGKDYE